MTLANLVSGRQEVPFRAVVYGSSGIGKSTFAADAPSPVFIGAESGTEQLDVQRFPTPADYTDVLDALAELTNSPHEFKSVVVDSLDWLEPLIWSHICQRDHKANIEDYNYGRGHVVALDEWRIFVATLERLRRQRNMNVILVAHSWIRPFRNPEGSDWERYEMKLHAKAAGLITEWGDALLFANYETLTATDDRTKRVKGVSTGARVIHTVRSAAFDAKNRYSLPDVLPLSFAEFEAAMKAGVPANAGDLIVAINAEAESASPELAAQAAGFIAKANGDASKLAKTLNWVRARVETQGGNANV
jgi:hypothetical protein